MLTLYRPTDSTLLVFSGLYEPTLPQAICLAGNFEVAKTHHLYHLARFFADLRSHGYIVLDDNIDVTPSKMIAIFLDVPRDESSSKSLIASSDESILILAEHPYYQPQFWKQFASCVDIVIHSYDLPASLSCTRSFASITSFAYRDLPDCTDSSGVHHDTDLSKYRHDVTYSTSIFCSNFVAPTESLYGFRRHLINASVALYRSKFLHCGKGWLYPKNPKGVARQIKHSIIARKNRMPAVSLDSYLGSPPSKALLRQCKTTFAVENFLEPRCYTTEKPLEALSYGCLPVYVGPRDQNWLSSYMDIYSASSFEVLSCASRYAHCDFTAIQHLANSLRSSINDFLLTSERTSLAILHSHILDSYG